jgi:carbonic anhydrase
MSFQPTPEPIPLALGPHRIVPNDAAGVAPAYFYTFENIEENVRHQLQKLHTHPWIPRIVAVRGFVYDVISGLLREIKDT